MVESARVLVEAAQKSEDAKTPAIAWTADALSAALDTWQRAGSALPDCEGVLTAANIVLDALHEVNPEGLPFGVRDPATEMQTLLDQAQENGFRIEASGAPAP